jgi:hypothetical protein
MAASVNGSQPVEPRDDWFDRLARKAAGGMSRRDAIGFFGGTTAMAFLGVRVKPAIDLDAVPHAMKDPGCAGNRVAYKAGCSKPVPKPPPYKPPVNGCGPQKGVNIVPQQPLYIADFTSACNGHDRGYGTCNVPKEVTDKKFLEDMKFICGGPIQGVALNMLLYQCNRNAEIFYTFVSSWLGNDPYKDGQENACDCCEECPGDTMKCSGQCCPPAGKYVCGSSGLCCADCQPGWIKCPYPANTRCGFGCCMPGSPICCPGMQPGSLRCCNGKCYKGGCG